MKIKKKVKVVTKQVAPKIDPLAQQVADLIWKHGYDFHIHKPKLLKKHNLDPKKVKEVLTAAESMASSRLAELFKKANLDPKDRFINVVVGHEELDPQLNDRFYDKVHERKRPRARPVEPSPEPNVLRIEEKIAPVVKAQKPKKDEPAQKGRKKPGVVAEIVNILKRASKKKPITKAQILDQLVKKFPDRAPHAMKNTISSQVPSALWTEKKLKVATNDKGGFWL